MDCHDLEIQIHAHLDGELDAANSHLVEGHLTNCATCRARFDELQRLSQFLKAPILRHPVPTSLRNRIEAAYSPRPLFPSGAWLGAKWVTPAVSFALGALLVWIAPQVRGLRGEDALEREVIAGHVRSLMVSHLSDVISTDQHTVKPWFTGKLDFSPPVTDFSTEGFALIGGRLDYLDKQAVSAVVYQRNQHRINVFVWPAKEAGGTQPKWEFEQGYHLAHWRSHGMNYWAISDLNAKELGVLVSLLETR
jgi:anti-sigma factor RsiW